MKENNKIRLWLAPRAVLLSLFDNEQVVSQIIQMRTDLYNEMRRTGAEGPESFSLRFKEAFSQQTPFNDLIDYKVTTTNPNR